MEEFDNNENYIISFTIDEIKPLLLREIPIAHDPKGMFNLSNLKIFNYYHEKIEEYFKRYKFKKPSMADKLAFIVLMSYPEYKIRDANSFECFKLFTENKDSDFEIIEIIDSEYNENDEDVEDRYDCICSYKKLKKVFKVENKFSSIRLCVGCECIKTYCLVSEKELAERSKEMDNKRKNNKERKKELNQGLPFGYYEEQRRQLKLKKLEENETKKREKELKQREKEQDKINTGNYRRCYECDKSIINIKNNRGQRFCNICLDKNNNLFKLNDTLVWTYKKIFEYIHCSECEIPFISKKCDDKYLCKNCETSKKVTECKWCSKLFLDNINSNDKYCDDCSKFITTCIDCNNDFKNIYKVDRCVTCQYNYDNKCIIVSCQECKNDFPKKQKEDWKKICNICFTDNKKILTSKICNLCDEEFDVKNNESWKKICKNCYRTSVNKYKCLRCNNEFSKSKNDTWKTMCHDCYLYLKTL